MKTKELGVTT